MTNNLSQVGGCAGVSASRPTHPTEPQLRHPAGILLAEFHAQFFPQALPGVESDYYSWVYVTPRSFRENLRAAHMGWGRDPE